MDHFSSQKLLLFVGQEFSSNSFKRLYLVFLLLHVVVERESGMFSWDVTSKLTTRFVFLSTKFAAVIISANWRSFCNEKFFHRFKFWKKGNELFLFVEGQIILVDTWSQAHNPWKFLFIKFFFFVGWNNSQELSRLFDLIFFKWFFFQFDLIWVHFWSMLSKIYLFKFFFLWKGRRDVIFVWFKSNLIFIDGLLGSWKDNLLNKQTFFLKFFDSIDIVFQTFSFVDRFMSIERVIIVNGGVF